MDTQVVRHVKAIHRISGDEKLLKALCNTLRYDSQLSPSSNIEVEVRDGEVILSGEVPYRQDKIRIEKILLQTKEIRILTNNLKVSSDKLYRTSIKSSGLQDRLSTIRVGTLDFSLTKHS